jgi:hypothetical protein
MFVSPVKHVLRGISFEGSSFDKESFYATVFVLPLCVPTRHLYFNFGDRIRGVAGGDRWNGNAMDALLELRDAIKRDALPFLSRVESLHGFIELAQAFSMQNPHTSEAIAYAWARSGEVTRANEELNRLARLLDLKIPWQREMAERAGTLKVKLANPADAQRQLEAWEAETLQNLGLKKFRE